MTTYVTPIDSQTDPDAPLTSELAKRWDNNLVSVLELDATAPKMKVSVEADSAGSIVDPTVIDGLSNFNGVILNGFIGNVSSGESVISLALSDDGVTYGSELTIITTDLIANGSFKCFVDLSTGVVKGAYQCETSIRNAGSITGTIAGGGASVSHLRVSVSTANHDVYTIAERVGEII